MQILRSAASGGNAPMTDPPRTGGKPRLELRSILLCTDYSQPSLTALRAAVPLCRASQARITLLYVCETGPIAAPSDAGLVYIEQLMAEDMRRLRDEVADLKALGVRVEPLYLDGNAPTVILQQAQRLEADLIVLGTRAAHGMERVLFGSTAEAVLRRAECPVLTVGPGWSMAGEQGHDGPVVFATDFHGPADATACYAAQMANMLGTPLHCVHVLPLSARQNEEPAIAQIMLEALRKLAKENEACDLQPVVKVLYGADVSHSIVEYAAAQRAQVIVLGVRRKTRWASHLPPQRTDRILMTASCPVLTLSSEREVASAIVAACL